MDGDVGGGSSGDDQGSRGDDGRGGFRSNVQPSHAEDGGGAMPAATTTAGQLSHMWLMVTFTDGTTLGEGMHVLGSGFRPEQEPWDGQLWTPLRGDPLVFQPRRHAQGFEWDALGGPPTVFRDPSITWHDGWFHLVFTTELCAGIPTVAFHCDRKHLRADMPPRFGYARSRDLTHWSSSRPVDVPLRGACNIWAPEWHLLTPAESAAHGRAARTGQPSIAMVIFSATVPRSQEDVDCPWDFGPSAGRTRHLPYYMLTSDFRSWSTPELLFDPGESVIDTFLFRAPAGGAHGEPLTYAVHKSEHNGDPSRPCTWQLPSAGSVALGNASCTLVLRLSRASTPFGPFERAPLAKTPVWSDAISHQCSEGPTVLDLPRGGWLVLFDGYRTDCPAHAPRRAGREAACAELPSSGLHADPQAPDSSVCTYRGSGGFGALISYDLRSWVDVSAERRPQFPPSHKHGTALRLSVPSLCALCKHLGIGRGSVGKIEKTSNLSGHLWWPTGVLTVCSQWSQPPSPCTSLD